MVDEWRVVERNKQTDAPMRTTNDPLPTFSAGASLRVTGRGLILSEITQYIGYEPSHSHKEGELNQLKESYLQDMWLLSSPLDKAQALESHIAWLAGVLLPRKDYILELRNRFNVDIYCYKTLYTEQASLNLSSKTLRLFTELDLELGVSLICLLGGTDPDVNEWPTLSAPSKSKP